MGSYRQHCRQRVQTMKLEFMALWVNVHVGTLCMFEGTFVYIVGVRHYFVYFLVIKLTIA